MKHSTRREAPDAEMPLAGPPLLMSEHTRQPKVVLHLLAAAGICGPILFTVGFVVQGLLRTDLRAGYNPIAQQISDLTAGPLGGSNR